MSSFWDLVGFEYKKIFKKKAVIVTLILTVTITILSFVLSLVGYHYEQGKPTESKYESMVKDRKYARDLAGRSLDKKLFIETGEAYFKVPMVEKYSSTKEYKLYARPYSGVHNIMRKILGNVRDLTETKAENFYNIRNKELKERVDSQTLKDTSKTKLLELDQKVKKPFIFDYTEGYQKFFAFMYTTGIVVCFASAICISSIFCGEYTRKTDQLILCSKHGKGKVIFAKIFTGISLSAVLSLVMTFVTYLSSMLIYGFDGGGAPFQLLMPMSPYPLTMKQVALVFSLCVFFGNLFSTGITLLLSSKLKSPFGVIVIISILIIIPMFINAPETNVLLHNIISLIPANMMGLWTITSPILYEFFGMSVEPYIFIPIFAGVATILLLPFAYKGFKYHEVGGR